MLLEWKMPNLFTVWGEGQKDAPALKLLPGMNTVKKTDWDKVCKKKDVQHYVDEDLLIVHDEDDESSSETLDSLEGLDAKKANQIIKKTFDLELLALWEGTEKRASVVKTLKAQVKKVNESVKLKEKDDDE